MFRHQILGLLRDGEARHGYALVKEYTRRTGLEANMGSAYRDLQKLADGGLIETASSSDGAEGRRRPYRITDLGRESFDSWFARVPVVQFGGNAEFAARAIFFDDVARDRVVEVLNRWREEFGMLRARIDRVMRGSPSNEASGGVLPARLERRRALANAEIEFVDDLLQSFHANAQVNWQMLDSEARGAVAGARPMG